MKKDVNWYLTAKYGIYITLAYEGHNVNEQKEDRYRDGCGCFSDGRLPEDVNDLADNFDVEHFAQMCEELSMDYVTFTIYHAHLYTLFPSKVVEAKLPNHTSKRDVIRELIDALKKRNIRTQVYIHATIGDTMTESERETLGWYRSENNYKEWNDFICAFFEEISERYGEDIDSYYIDMIFDMPYLEMIDKLRVRKALLSHNKNAIITGNGEANSTVDYGSRENCSIVIEDINQKRVFPTQTVIDLSSIWWSTHSNDVPNTTVYSSEYLIKLFVLTAASNTDGGGLAFGVGLYCDRGFEPGIYESIKEVSKWLSPIEKSIKNTLPSNSYVTVAGDTIPSLVSGTAATQSPDGAYEYLHVLTPPKGQTLTLPTPADGSLFGEAIILTSGHTAKLVQNEQEVTIHNPDEWDALDTVIKVKRIGRTPAKTGETADAKIIEISASDSVLNHDVSLLIDGCKDTYWQSTVAEMHSITIKLDCIHTVNALHLLPKQGEEVPDVLRPHINSYAVSLSLDGKHYTNVATGDLKRSLMEDTVSFYPMEAQYVQLTLGPDWFICAKTEFVAFSGLRVQTIKDISK